VPEGSIIFLCFGLVIAASFAMVVHCLNLAHTYKRIERDMRCIHNGTEQDVLAIIHDRNDWFRRSVRLRKDTYPYYEDVLISDVRTVR
jgi:hypothetical protein